MQRVLRLSALTALAVGTRRSAASSRSPLYFRCPSCGDSLLPSAGGNTLRCASGHAVDAAKEGHYYLLKRPLAPAIAKETEEMARSARAFHDAGGFATYADSLALEIARALLDGPSPADGPAAPRQVLAAGCSDGVYLRAVEQALRSRGVFVGSEEARRETHQSGDKSSCHKSEGSEHASEAQMLKVGLWGVDPCKLAVRYAAKRQPSAHFAVASMHALPFADGVFDLVFSAFGQSSWDE